MEVIFLSHNNLNVFLSRLNNPSVQSLESKVKTRLGVDKVKPKGWFKYCL